jgi:hypothetical protein
MLTALWLVTSAAGLAGGVADAPYSARLLGQLDVPDVDRTGLARERARLIETRPGFGFPITMMSIGAGVSFLFIAITASVANSYAYSYSSAPGEFYAVMGVLIAAALGMVAIGVVSLILRLQSRNETDARLKVIDQKIGPLRPNERLPVDDGLAPPPPGPPPPPPGPDLGPPGPPPPPPPPLATLFSF